MAIGVMGAAVAVPETIAHADTTVGSVRGQVKDKATGEPGVGATVVATSSALQGEQTVLADDNGLYFLTSLPPGDYTLTVYYNDGTFTRNNVIVQVGKEAVVNITVDSASTAGKPKGETIEVNGSPPVIDQGSTKTGTTLTSDYTTNVPVARTFGGALTAASGSQNDFYGVSIAGTTSAENVYVVEGINTTDTARGGISSNLPNEFVQETEIITGGYNAEYGRATGGIVNVVTKQGSNEIHGSVFAYYSPGRLSSSANTVQKEGGSIDTQSNLNYNYDLGAEVGGPIIKDRLWFHIGFNPSRTANTTRRLIQQQVDVDGDGVADVDPRTGITLHKEVTHQDIPDAQTTYFFTAKLNGEIAPNHAIQLSLFGNPSSGDRPTNTDNGPFAPGASLFDRSNGSYDAALKYTGKFNGGQTQIDALAGFHAAYSRSTPHNEIGGRPLVQYNYSRSLYDFADIETPGIDKCQDNVPGDMYPGIQNCPVDQYSEQGLGVLEKRTNDRLSALLSATQRQVRRLSRDQGRRRRRGLELQLDLDVHRRRAVHQAVQHRRGRQRARQLRRSERAAGHLAGLEVRVHPQAAHAGGADEPGERPARAGRADRRLLRRSRDLRAGRCPDRGHHQPQHRRVPAGLVADPPEPDDQRRPAVRAAGAEQRQGHPGHHRHQRQQDPRRRVLAQQLGAAHRRDLRPDLGRQVEDVRALGSVLREHPDGHQRPLVRRRDRRRPGRQREPAAARRGRLRPELQRQPPGQQHQRR